MRGLRCARNGRFPLTHWADHHVLSHRGKAWRRYGCCLQGRGATCLRPELSPSVCNEPSSQGRYADCRSGPRLQKVEPISTLKLLLSRLDELVARVFEE